MDPTADMGDIYREYERSTLLSVTLALDAAQMTGKNFTA